MNYLPPSDLARLSRVNKNWYQASLHHPKWDEFAKQLKAPTGIPFRKESFYDFYEEDEEYYEEEEKTPVKLDRSTFFQSLASGKFCSECLTQNSNSFRCISPSGTYTTSLICDKCYKKNHTAKSGHITPELVNSQVSQVTRLIKVKSEYFLSLKSRLSLKQYLILIRKLSTILLYMM